MLHSSKHEGQFCCSTKRGKFLLGRASLTHSSAKQAVVPEVFIVLLQVLTLQVYRVVEIIPALQGKHGTYKEHLSSTTAIDVYTSTITLLIMFSCSKVEGLSIMKCCGFSLE
jgi:hypothetical protein